MPKAESVEQAAEAPEKQNIFCVDVSVSQQIDAKHSHFKLKGSC